MQKQFYFSIIICIFCVTVFGQVKKKTTFRVLGGINYIARTNFSNDVYLGSPSTEYHEKGKAGLSFQVLSSFYLSKEWRLTTGIIMDKKGYLISGAGVFASSINTMTLTNYKMQETANYLGIPVEIEQTFLKTNIFNLSFDVGIAEQWKTSGVGNGEYFVKNQFTFLGGLNFIVPYHHISFIAHPTFRYSPTQLEKSSFGGASPSYNSYSVGIEFGVLF